MPASSTMKFFAFKLYLIIFEDRTPAIYKSIQRNPHRLPLLTMMNELLAYRNAFYVS